MKNKLRRMSLAMTVSLTAINNVGILQHYNHNRYKEFVLTNCGRS